MKVRLTYFDGAGRAELSRLILAAAEIEYEDRRIDRQDWEELKPGELYATGGYE
jgi:glutathione S-transferase